MTKMSGLLKSFSRQPLLSAVFLLKSSLMLVRDAGDDDDELVSGVRRLRDHAHVVGGLAGLEVAHDKEQT